MNTAIYRALCACFGLSPSSEEASVLIREAWQDPENNPRPPRDANVIYYSVLPDPAAREDPPAYAGENPAAASHVPAVSRFTAWSLQIVCYGPGALENAKRIRSLLFLDGAGYPRAILRKAGIRPVPDPNAPVLLHEPEGSLWRRRADLTVSLRMEEKESHPARRGAVALPPPVVIHH